MTGGHPNSLGDTIAVVDEVLRDEGLLDHLIATYGSNDEVVRLRVSNAVKRVCHQRPEWVYARLSTIEEWVNTIEQPSAQWTLAQVYALLSDRLTEGQRQHAVSVLKRFLTTCTDWIVLNFSMQTLADWAIGDPALRQWLVPQLARLTTDPRKSVARRATRLLKEQA